VKRVILGLGLTVAVASLGYLNVDAGYLAEANTAKSDADSHVIEITAKRFEFVPKEVTLKKGEPVILRLKSEDVAHGFFVRPLKVDAEIPAGKSTDIAVTPQSVGKFTTICDHFCGVNHGNMKMIINVVE
jgi:cytochrome c oxidase subunit 2